MKVTRNYEMAVIKPESASKHGNEKSGLNGHSMAHERVYSGGGRQEFLFAGHDQTGQPSFVAMTRKFAHGTSCFLQEKPVVNGPMTGQRQILCDFFLALLRNCEQYN